MHGCVRDVDCTKAGQDGHQRDADNSHPADALLDRQNPCEKTTPRAVK
jgi:hypothetical protein